MTTMCESESALASKCLDLCQTLVSQGLAFKFSLNSVGFGFSFALKGASLEEAKTIYS